MQKRSPSRTNQKASRKVPLGLTFHPLAPARWADFEKLFGPRGAYCGCWCMYWRLTRKEFTEGQGEGNRRAMKSIVGSGRVAGILAYLGKEAVGWCSVGPRADFPGLDRSRVLKRLDDQPVWSIVCFFIAKEHRGKAIGEELIRAAVKYAKIRGAKIVEAYPTLPRGRKLAPVSVYMGIPALFKRAGFVECARPSSCKVVMRHT
ncbi:MAG TPA: GNAT family N-acetyltransferase [bacterium]|nr:GNAT family N-acetyltransferase [bacterium]